jgi:beta-lactamase class D
MLSKRWTSAVGLAWVCAAPAAFLASAPTPTPPDKKTAGECFLLQALGSEDIRRSPSAVCDLRVTPASTFKIPHALAALDSGVAERTDHRIEFAGGESPFPSWQRDHTLASAMRHSVVWYFQRIAERLGMERERRYLERFEYGNADPSSGLTTFWLGGSLLISPEEQLRFLRRLYLGELPASPEAMEGVRRILVQPPNVVTSALGETPLSSPWPEGAVVSAKTGRARDHGGSEVRWLVGHVRRGEREWVFVSCVVGGVDLPANAAIELAGRSLHEPGVL